MIVVEPAPPSARFAIVTTCREKLQIPIAGLDDTELRAIRSNCPRDNSRAIDVPYEEGGSNKESYSDTGYDDSGANSHGNLDVA
jgi:hypothetical protein